MLALIDADIVLYRIGFTTETEDWPIAKWRCDELLDSILIDTNSDEYRLYLSDSAENNFRYKIWPEYKANRVAPKPKHYNALKEYLITEWGAKIAFGMEADDALGIDQDNGHPLYDIPPEVWTTVLCSIDKDLLQIPGHHWNFVKKEWKIVEPSDAKLSFYRSILTGDVADNIPGCWMIGAKKAEKLLPKWESEDKAIEVIFDSYYKWYQKDKLNHKELYDIIKRNAQLLKIKQTEEEPLWDSPKLKQMVESTPSYIPPAEAESNPSTEPTGPEIKK